MRYGVIRQFSAMLFFKIFLRYICVSACKVLSKALSFFCILLKKLISNGIHNTLQAFQSSLMHINNDWSLSFLQKYVNLLLEELVMSLHTIRRKENVAMLSKSDVCKIKLTATKPNIAICLFLWSNFKNCLLHFTETFHFFDGTQKKVKAFESTTKYTYNATRCFSVRGTKETSDATCRMSMKTLTIWNAH